MPRWKNMQDFRENASEDIKGFAEMFDWQQEHPEERRLRVRMLGLTFMVQSLGDLVHIVNTMRDAGVRPEDKHAVEVTAEEAIEV